MSGEVAVERVEYRAIVSLKDGGTTTEDTGKGLHVYRRERDGSWKLSDDIWNSDLTQT
jgi:ketosteroid isomerase-like protein